MIKEGMIFDCGLVAAAEGELQLHCRLPPAPLSLTLAFRSSDGGGEMEREICTSLPWSFLKIALTLSPFQPRARTESIYPIALSSLLICPSSAMQKAHSPPHIACLSGALYRDGPKSGPVLLSKTQAMPGKKFTQPRDHFFAHLCI